MVQKESYKLSQNSMQGMCQAPLLGSHKGILGMTFMN